MHRRRRRLLKTFTIEEGGGLERRKNGFGNLQNSGQRKLLKRCQDRSIQQLAHSTAHLLNADASNYALLTAEIDCDMQ